MTQQKIIFFDIDSTLLNEEKRLPESTRDAIRRLQEDGHIVAIATGRTPFTFAELLEELNIDTYVSLNGQYVVHDNEVIYKNPLDPVALQQLTEFAGENGHPLVYVDHEDWRSTVEQHPFIDDSVASLKVGRDVTFDPSYLANREIYQALLFCTEENEQTYANKFDRFHFVRWHDYSVDVMPAGGSKADGIKKLADILGIAPENMYAFGDGLNDIEMLKYVENSVAMGNAHDSAKKAAKYVTTDINDDGILRGLELVGLL